MDGDVKVFDLICQVVQWEYTPGKRVEAWTYNGVTPGPEIRVTEGDKVRVHVTNELPQSTAVHWHGLMVPNSHGRRARSSPSRRSSRARPSPTSSRSGRATPAPTCTTRTTTPPSR